MTQRGVGEQKANQGAPMQLPHSTPRGLAAIPATSPASTRAPWRARTALVIGLIGATAALAGCDQHMSAVANASNLEGVGPVTLALRSDHITPTIRSQIDQWNRTHKSETVTLNELPAGSSAARNAVTSDASNGREHSSILELPFDQVAEFADHGWIAQLPSTNLALDSMPDPVAQSVRYSGSVYAVPYSLDVALLYYRADLLQKAGAQPPSTWDDVAADCAAIANPQHLNCFGLPLSDKNELTRAAIDAVSTSDGALIDSNDAPAADTDQAREGIGALVSRAQDGTITRDQSSTALRSAFTDGKLLFLRDTADSAGALTAAQPPTETAGQDGSVGVATVPSVHGGGSVTAEGDALAVSASAEHQETALSVIAYLAHSRNADARTAADGTPTPYPQHWTNAVVQRYPALGVVRDATSGAVPCLPITRYAAFSEAVSDALGQSLRGEASVDQALAGLQRRLENLLG